MPIREKRIYSGKYLEVEIYPITKNEQKQKRGKKNKISLPKQKNLNDKNSKKHLRRLINANFTDKDIVFHGTYDEENLPKSEEEAKKNVQNFLRRIKTYRKKNGLEPLKYIAVTEYKEATEDKRTKTRIHHHIVMSGMDRDEAERIWGKGKHSNADRLKANELGYEELANYIAKDPKGSKRWCQSKNLQQPIVKVNDYKYSHKKVWELSQSQGDKKIFENLYPGYRFTDHRVEVNDINSGTYIYIKMRQLN
ncbi:hypothetical protein NNC19_19305 [Clostridium sp. SHJSY1]|uniref:rolling circle replication-associated protein n=1 Tax=Clostridium sp. SHJSY1 TaxID=2942483 RepID=UPI0028761FA5|nr:hypothetical protein [Clostridium sp. SHJSY1]MDS0527844.1 hypothetical protein [Clostridium sp. SHJSY1]